MAAQNKFTTCTFILKKCDFSSASLAPTCVKNFCQGEPYGFGSCTADFTGVPAECCSQSTVGDVAQCMADFQQQQGYGIFGDACLSVERYVTECENANSEFDNASFKQQAGYTWDNAVATCVSTGESAHPTIWSALQKNSQVIGLCTKFAGAAAPTGPATTGPIPTDTASFASTGDASPGTTAADTASPTETGSTPAGTTGSSDQTPAPSSATSAASSSAAATTTTSRSAAVRVGEMSYSQIKLAAVGLGLMLPAFLMTL
ncbi:hypothetical protein N5P37_004358 [Trichoderma harzianum]|uniref:Uncharacterized protein n=1 Tax=Trichoderma harzianum CBS 226.95 TaxID=983964 RepID=A0A2T3ZTZ7_TRIHA|nr:hypothetical protein M431DRAFT_501356 [Trichoderma harzianum CBS 226.95]KAK0762836.1 hypothetical protein N5P37_004358 [Trichoderma harzianum]PTB48275.1 hypothetical protein M431DRAFT_501356 [Trichoderma harzianum CBS 226.95]